MHVSLVLGLHFVGGAFPHFVFHLHGVGLHCYRGVCACVLSVTASAEHLTINIGHPSCRGFHNSFHMLESYGDQHIHCHDIRT